MAEIKVTRHKFSHKAPLAERLAHYSMPAQNGCILWTGSTNQKGYAHLAFRGRLRRVTRLMMEQRLGELDAAVHVLHRCDNPRCINPDHLFLGDNTANVADKVSKERQAKKMTRQDVLEIRADPRLHREIAADYGVSRSLVGFIKLRKSWGHVP